MLRSRWVLGAIALLALGGCDDPPGPFVTLPEDPDFPGTPGNPDQHAGLFQHQSVPSCAVSNPTNLAVATPLRIFRGAGVSDADLNYFLGGLQRYYAQYGVSLSTAYDVIPLPMREAMILNVPALYGRVKEMTGIDLNRVNPNTLPAADQARVEAALGAAMMNNVREILRVYGKPRRPEINVVVLPAMALNISPQLMDLQGLLGLGVSPELLASFPPGDPGQQLYTYLDVTDEFTPTAIVGVAPVKKYLPYPDVAIAHELGHAYGLAHVTTTGNLLHQGDIACDLELETTQLGRIVVASGANAVGIEAGSLVTRMGDLQAGIRRILYSR